MRQVSGRAEDDDRAWLRHSPRAQTFAQWIDSLLSRPVRHNPQITQIFAD